MKMQRWARRNRIYTRIHTQGYTRTNKVTQGNIHKRAVTGNLYNDIQGYTQIHKVIKGYTRIHKDVYYTWTYKDILKDINRTGANLTNADGRSRRHCCSSIHDGEISITTLMRIKGAFSPINSCI